jgi:transposase
MNQVILPMDLAYKLQGNDIVFAVINLVESIPGEALT